MLLSAEAVSIIASEDAKKTDQREGFWQEVLGLSDMEIMQDTCLFFSQVPLCQGGPFSAKMLFKRLQILL